VPAQLEIARDSPELSFIQFMKKLETKLGRRTNLIERQRAKNHYSYGRSPAELYRLIERGERR
jgi:hypothetical protein